MRLRMTRKMIIFQKLNHTNASTKMIIFHSFFTPIFWVNFKLHYKISLLSTHIIAQSFNVFSMAPKPKKGATPIPQPPSGPKWAWKSSLKVINSQAAPTVNFSDDKKATSQLQPLKSKVAVHCISWMMARTEQLPNWLEENPMDWHKLFSDSMKDAKDEGWWKHVAKGTKSELHKLIAIFIFSVNVDKDVQDDFAVNGGNYTKSVDNYLGCYVFCFILQLILISFFQVMKEVSVIQWEAGADWHWSQICPRYWGGEYPIKSYWFVFFFFFFFFFFFAMAYANNSSFLEQLEQEFPFWRHLHGF